jgi:hypothetical protein
MTGESDEVRQRALARLDKRPKLKETLQNEITGPKRALALDVISALNYQSLLPDLLKIAGEDETGFVFLTINNLMTDKNRAELVTFYKKQLLCKHLCTLSAPSKVVILETLGRLNEALGVADLQSLYKEATWPEVQGAVLDYARLAVLKFKKNAYAVLLKQGLEAEALQLREQALTAIAELPAERRATLLPGLAVPARMVYAEHAPANVRVAFGYKDARPARFVGDRYERMFLIHELMGACEGGNQACGFERDKKDMNVFMKTVKVKEQEFVIRVNITASAAGPDDDDNRTNPYQKHLTHNSRENFLEGVRVAEAVYYVGHSRDGGGPDFKPPRMTKQKHVEYPWYVKNKPGLKSLLANLKTDKKHERGPLKLGLLSCASTQLFEKRIKEVHAKVELVTVPRLLYYMDGLEMLRKELSKYIQNKINGYDPKS